MSEYRWKGQIMGAVKVSHEGGSHAQIHLWGHPDTQDTSLCGKLSWRRDVQEAAATGWPDCNDCIYEAYRRMVTA